jgi:hypothetical protein
MSDVTVETTRAITPVGVGRLDYTNLIEFSVVHEMGVAGKALSGRQYRAFYAVRWVGLPAIVSPFVYSMPLAFLVDGIPTYLAPKTPYVFYNVYGTADRNAMTVVCFNRYLTWADYLTQTLAEQYGCDFGYGSAHLGYSKGIPTIENNVYGVWIAEQSGLPFNYNLALHAFVAGQEELP